LTRDSTGQNQCDALLVGRSSWRPALSFTNSVTLTPSHLVKTVAHSKIVQERLGHSTIAITMDLYSPLLDGMETGAAERIDEDLAIAKEQPPV
jgi:integrase